MWCRHCGQDVPARPAIAGAAGRTCARCSKPFAAEAAAEVAVPTTAPPLEDPELEEDLRAARAAVRKFHVRHGGGETATPAPTQQFRAETAQRPKPPARRGTIAFFSWAALSLGMIGFSCGAVLLIWAFCAERNELWAIGLPITFLGQSALVLGLVLQLDGLSRASRETSRELQQLDDQLGELRHTTTLLGTTHSSAAQSFYAHMADGGNPHLLLADLKGQLDLLAVQLARRSQFDR